MLNLTFATFMKEATKGHIAVVLTNIFFAGNYSVIKMISPQPVAPFALNIIRVGFSVILFWVVWMFGNTEAGIQKRDLKRFLLCGITGIAINQMFFIKGLTLTTTIHASLLILITPIIVTVFAIWVLKERFTGFKALGLLLGVSGATFLIMQKEVNANASNYLLGDILILINAISYSIYFIIVKPLTKKYSPLHVIRWVFTIGFFMMLPFGWQDTVAIDWSLFRWYHYAGLFSVSFTGTFLAYYFNAYGIRTIGAGPTGTYIYTQPLIVAVIAILFLEESFTLQKIISGLLIIAGVLLVNMKMKEAGQAQLSKS